MIGIMSDSHDNLNAIRRVVAIFKDAGCELLIHAGDFIAPFAARELDKAGCPVRGVFGNCDGEKRGLAAAIAPFGVVREAPFIFDFDSVRILITHMDSPVESYAAEQAYDLVVFGHTHRAEIRKQGKTLILNPGETGGWLTRKKTAALFDPKTSEADIISL
jgi:putative phosphoesterase